MSTIIGLDASLSSTGIAVLQDDNLIHIEALIPDKKLRGGDRLLWLYNRTEAILSTYNPTLVVIEGYAYVPGQALTVLTELGGVLRLLCAQKSIPIAVLSPCSNKLIFTGSGKATKLEMMEEAKKRYPDAEIITHDVADAIALATFGKTLKL